MKAAAESLIRTRVWLAVTALAVALWTAGCACTGDEAGGVDLSRMEGWDIVVAEDAIPSERYAAEEFQMFFEQAAGVKLPIVHEVEKRQGHVFIGLGVSPKSSLMHFNSSFGPEEFEYAAHGDRIIITGGRPRGTLYGVYTFMEDQLGVRFLTADHTHVPRIRGSRVIGPLSRFYHPPLEFRYPYYGENHKDHAFATRMRVNTVSDDPRLGGKAPQRLINHSLSGYVPWNKYGREHPEYFDEIGGKRPKDIKNDHYGPGVQLCLTNPEVLRIVAEGVLADLERHPEWKNISVSQNDNGQHCQCAACAAIDRREGTAMGSLLTFVNAVADVVAKKHPGVMVGTLSYQYSRKPPKTLKPRPNVQIQLCSIECCLIHPIDDPACPLNVPFCNDMTGWGKICGNIYVWNYNTNFWNYLLPCPNLRVIEPNVRYFVRNNAKGIFMQAAGNAMGAELSDLRNYVIANLLWDPNRSGQELMDEFLDLHYGRAAPPIRRFINLVHDKAQASGLHHHCFGFAADYGLDETVAQEGLKAFDEAMKLADDEAVRLRVEKASISAYRLAIEPVCVVAFQPPWKELNARADPELVARMRPLVRRLFELCAKHGVTMATEGMPIEQARKRMREALRLNEGEEF